MASPETIPSQDELPVTTTATSEATPVPVDSAASGGSRQVWPRRIDSNRNLWIPITSVNPHIVCGLCQGYLYEACTITECMHSFCRNCLVKHIQRSLNCPMCAILIHPTDPFVHIRLDGLLQNIVYALLPEVEKLELEREKIFYEQHEDDRVDSKKTDSVIKPRAASKAYAIQQSMASAFSHHGFDYIPPVSLCLQFLDPDVSEKRKLDKQFIRVTGAATIQSLSTYLKRKLNMEEDLRVSFYCPCRSGFVSLSNGHTLKAVKDLYCYDQDIVQLKYDINEP